MTVPTHDHFGISKENYNKLFTRVATKDYENLGRAAAAVKALTTSDRNKIVAMIYEFVPAAYGENGKEGDLDSLVKFFVGLRQANDSLDHDAAKLAGSLYKGIREAQHPNTRRTRVFRFFGYLKGKNQGQILDIINRLKKQNGDVVPMKFAEILDLFYTFDEKSDTSLLIALIEATEGGVPRFWKKLKDHVSDVPGGHWLSDSAVKVHAGSRLAALCTWFYTGQGDLLDNQSLIKLAKVLLAREANDVARLTSCFTPMQFAQCLEQKLDLGKLIELCSGVSHDVQRCRAGGHYEASSDAVFGEWVHTNRKAVWFLQSKDYTKETILAMYMNDLSYVEIMICTWLQKKPYTEGLSVSFQLNDNPNSQPASASLGHVLGRHTFKHFTCNQADVKVRNSFWPRKTGAGEVYEVFLGIKGKLKNAGATNGTPVQCVSGPRLYEIVLAAGGSNNFVPTFYPVVADQMPLPNIAASSFIYLSNLNLRRILKARATYLSNVNELCD